MSALTGLYHILNNPVGHHKTGGIRHYLKVWENYGSYDSLKQNLGLHGTLFLNCHSLNYTFLTKSHCRRRRRVRDGFHFKTLQHVKITRPLLMLPLAAIYICCTTINSYFYHNDLLHIYCIGNVTSRLAVQHHVFYGRRQYQYLYQGVY